MAATPSDLGSGMSDLSAGAEPRPKEKEADTQVLTCMSDMMSVSGQRHDRTALILYGSETGNAQDVADELGRLTERLRFTTQVSPLDEIDPVRAQSWRQSARD